MKKYAPILVLASLLVFCFPVKTTAQLNLTNAASENFAYFDLHAGWSFAHNTDWFGLDYIGNESGSTATNVYGSYGSGIRLGFEAGYYVKSAVSVSLGFDYIIGNAIKTSYMEDFSIFSYESMEEYKARHGLVSIKGNYTKLCSSHPITVSFGCGPIISLGGTKKYISHAIQEDFNSETVTDWEEEYKLKPSLGITTHFAVLYNVSDQLSVGPTFSLNSIAAKYKSSTITAYQSVTRDPKVGTVFFEQDLSDLEPEQINTEYVDELTNDMEGVGFSYQLTDNASMAGIEVGLRVQYKFNRDVD